MIIKNSLCIFFIYTATLDAVIMNLCSIFFIDPERIYPLMNEVIEGEEAKFTCYSSGRTYWHFNDRIMLFGVGKTAYIPIVNQTNSGYYECTGFTDKDVQFMARGLLIALGTFPNVLTILLPFYRI